MRSNGILTSTIQVSITVLLIKMIGVLKQSVIAAVCGATLETDVYFIASSTINNLCVIIFSALTVSLLTMHTEQLIKDGRTASNHLINAVMRVFMPISLGITFLFAAGAPVISKVLAPTYTDAQHDLLTQYIRIMSPMFVFSCYHLIVNVTLETDKRFLPGKIQGLLQNACVVIAALMFYRSVGIKALLYAFLVSGLLQCIQITWSARNIWRFEIHVSSNKQNIQKLCRLMLPLLIGNAIYEINDIVDKQIAAGSGAGSVSFLSYGASINEIVTTLITTSLTTVLFSHFSTWVAEDKIDEICNSLTHSLTILFTLIVPVMVVCFTNGDLIVQILYGRGNFDPGSVRETAGVVIGYAAGFFFQAARANLIKVYYAFQNTRTPMINGAISVAFNICLSLILSRSIGVAGIALATSISMLLVTILLLPGIKKYLPAFSLKPMIADLAKGAVCGMGVYLLASFLRSLIRGNVFMVFLTTGLLVVIVYIMLLAIVRVSCMKTLQIMIKKKTSHKKIG